MVIQHRADLLLAGLHVLEMQLNLDEAAQPTVGAEAPRPPHRQSPSPPRTSPASPTYPHQPVPPPPQARSSLATIEQILAVFSGFTEQLSVRTPAGPCQARPAPTPSETWAHLAFAASRPPVQACSSLSALGWAWPESARGFIAGRPHPRG